jgi:hypothetical protein
MTEPFVDTWHDHTDAKKQEAARAMLAALKEKMRVDGNANRTLPEIEAANRAVYFAIAQAEAAGIATGEGK